MIDKNFSSEEQLFNFFKHQLQAWALSENNYRQLENVKKKEFHFATSKMIAMFNPARIRSSNAKVDSASIQARACFLCKENRPHEQKALTILDHYALLINPFPIFEVHLTIVDINHINQELSKERIRDILKLAKLLPSFSIFYNGSEAGASAPDHFHFQAGLKNDMPTEEDVYKDITILNESIDFTIKEKENYIRKIIILESHKEEVLTQIIEKIVYLIQEVLHTPSEPKINIVAFYKENKWQVCIFPRIAHRPAQFFKEGGDKILFSPGAVDMGGLLILPREEDFEKINLPVIEDMFNQITLNDENWQKLIKKLEILDYEINGWNTISSRDSLLFT